jgi:iron(III) transport system permease protein
MRTQDLPRFASRKPDGSGLALLTVATVASIVALPILAIGFLALSGTAGAWPSNLPRLVWTTVELCLTAAVISLAIGSSLAWLVTMYSFPGRRFLRWMALLPLALPGYIISFVYVDALTFAGPVQQVLRDVFGWAHPQDYWFPDIRSTWGAGFVMAFALFPYVYLAGLAAFMRQPINQLHAARSLGRGPLKAFLQIALPQARPALFVGALLVVMECINDIGAATFFGLGTVTTAVYSIWLDQGDLTGAARLAGLLILFMALLVYLETIAKARTTPDAKHGGLLVRTKLTGIRGVFAAAAVAIPILLGFVVPVIMLVSHSLRRWDEAFVVENALAAGRSALLAVLACVVTLLIALLLAHLSRTSGSKPFSAVTRLASLGYALPGTVLGIGVLVPFGQFDQWLNRVSDSVFGAMPGLVVSGGIFALVFAYVTRFLIIAVGHVEDGMNKIPTNMDHVARTLGRKAWQVFGGIHLPLLRPAMVAACLLVFVDTMKELPATLMLRPFDFDTLATRVFSLASLGQIEAAAIPALLIVLAGLLPVIVLARNLKNTG